MSILEAMSVGVPVVASCVGEIPLMIEDGKEGLLCHLDEGPGQWAARLLGLINPEKRQAMGVAGRQTVVGRFQELAMVDRYTNVLDLPCPFRA